MKDIKTVEAVVGAALASSGFELIDLIIQNQGGKKLLQFFVDKDSGGINLDECEKASRLIDGILEMENIVGGAYILEVSSPGIKRVLKKPAHFQKFIGERAHITLKLPIENRANFTGVITAADDKEMTLEDGTSKFVFKYEDIKKAHLDPVLEF